MACLLPLAGPVVSWDDGLGFGFSIICVTLRHSGMAFVVASWAMRLWAGFDSTSLALGCAMDLILRALSYPDHWWISLEISDCRLSILVVLGKFGVTDRTTDL